MKRLILLLLVAISINLVAQHKHDCGHVGCAIEGTGIDEFTFVPPPASFVPGAERDVVISVTYTGFTLQAQTAFQYAVDIWSSLLTSNVPILINANWEDIPGNTLGFAGAAYYENGFPGSGDPDYVYPAALADKIANSNLSNGSFDINATFDSGTNWYLGTDGNTPGGQYDFVSVVLHELCHGLGMIGSPAVEGANGIWQFGSNFRMIYDTFVENGSQTPITNFGNNTTALAAQLQSDNLFWNGSFAIAGNGGLKPRLYAPVTYSQGSSFSHLNESTYPAGNPNSLMTPFIGAAEAIHDPGALQLGIMEDIGWTVTNIGGNACEPTGIEAAFECRLNPDTDILDPVLVINTYFTGDCFVDDVCIQEAGAGSPTCYALQDFDIFLESTDGVFVGVNPNSSYQVWFTVDGQISDIVTVATGNCVAQPGCTNPFAINFNPSANVDNGGCIYNQTICDCNGAEHTIGVLTWLGDGFDDSGNYEWDGQLVDFNCSDWGYDCGDIAGSPSSDPYGVCLGNLPPNNGCGGLEIPGCTNPEASNYNASATNDNATCTYLGCEFYVDFEGFSNGQLVAQNSALITTWSAADGGPEDAVAQIGNASNGEVAMLIQQTQVDGGPDDVLIPIDLSSGQYNLDFDLFVVPSFGAYYNLQESVVPNVGFAIEVIFYANGTVALFEDAVLLFTGNYTPGQWIPVSHNVDLDNNILLLSVGTIVNFPVTYTTDLGSLNLYSFADTDTGYYLVDNISLCGDAQSPGCTDNAACNYDAAATSDDGSCEYLSCAGCLNPGACNYDATATISDNSCEFLSCAGCTNPSACNYDETATIEDGTCEFLSCAGCTNPNACNYDATATIENGSCEFLSCAGCTDSEACNYDSEATIDNGSCEYLTCGGCTDPEACNYDETALVNDGSCEYLTCAGCTDPEACNYDAAATFDDDSCEYLTCAGCTDALATNYNANATFDNGSCLYNFFICDCMGNQWPPNFRFELGNGIPNTGAFQANFDCEEWGYDCGDINGSPSLDPFNVCDGNLPPNNGCEVSVNEIADANWNLYPNPSEGIIYLTFSGKSSTVQIRMLDIEGRLIKEIRTSMQEGETLQLNDGQNLAPGAYFLQIVGDNDIVNKHFIVK